MKYNFDEIVNRRNTQGSYSLKWNQAPQLAERFGVSHIKNDVIPMFTADMDFRSAPPIIEALQEVVNHGIFGYSSFTDAPSYNNAIIGWFKRRMGWEIKPDELIYFPGTVEAIKQTILAFTEPGDGVIIQRPVYPPFAHVINDTNRVVINNQLIENNGRYTIGFDDLESKAKDPKTKLFILCSPHNPIGRIWTKEELIELARICKKHDVIVASDEVHGDLIRKNAVFYPLAALVDNSNVITMTAANKTFNLAGLHCTNLVVQNPQIRAKLVKSTKFVLPSPFAIAAVRAAYNECEEWLDDLLEYIDGNIDWSLKFLREHMPKVKCSRPEATYILWMDFRDYGLSSEEIHTRIYKKASVFLDSGQNYDPEYGAGYERICLPSPRGVVEEAFKRIASQF